MFHQDHLSVCNGKSTTNIITNNQVAYWMDTISLPKIIIMTIIKVINIVINNMVNISSFSVSSCHLVLVLYNTSLIYFETQTKKYSTYNTNKYFNNCSHLCFIFILKKLFQKNQRGQPQKITHIVLNILFVKAKKPKKKNYRGQQ